MNDDWKLRLEQQRERARRLDRENAEAIEKADAVIAKLKQGRAEYEEHLRRKNASTLTSTAGAKHALEDEHTTTAAKRPTPAKLPTLQQLSPLRAPVDDAHFQLGDNEDQTLGAAEDDDFDNLFALPTEVVSSGAADTTIDQPTGEDAYMADLEAEGEEEVQDEEVQEEEIQEAHPQEDEDEDGEGTEEAVVEVKRGRGRPKGKPKKGDQKAPLLPIYVWSTEGEGEGAWMKPEDLGLWDDVTEAMLNHIKKMMKGTKHGNTHKLFARVVANGDKEIGRPDGEFACFGCSVLNQNRRKDCNITVRHVYSCSLCVRRMRRPCGQLIRDPNSTDGFAYGFLPLCEPQRENVPVTQLAFWVRPTTTPIVDVVVEYEENDEEDEEATN